MIRRYPTPPPGKPACYHSDCPFEACRYKATSVGYNGQGDQAPATEEHSVTEHNEDCSPFCEGDHAPQAGQVRCDARDSGGARCSFWGAPGEEHDHFVAEDDR